MQFTVANLPAGKYRFDLVGRLGASFSATDTICTFYLTDGTETQAYTTPTLTTSSPTFRTQGFSQAIDVLTARTNVTFKVQGNRVTGGGDCSVVADDATINSLNLVLYRFPTDSQTAVSLSNTAVTTGTYAPFDTATCPQGWVAADGTNGTIDLRAMFVRGSGAQTVSGTLYTAGTLGSALRDQFQGHIHDMNNHSHSGTTGGNSGNVWNFVGSGVDAYGQGTVTGAPMYHSEAHTHSFSTGGPSTNNTSIPQNDGSSGTPRTGPETLPAHRVMTWCKQTATVSSPIVVIPDAGKPVVTRYTSGSGTHTLRPNVAYIRVRMNGGGGGGGGTGATAPVSAAGNGGNTTFGPMTANGGTGGWTPAGQASGGPGGSASLGSGPVGTAAVGQSGGMSAIATVQYSIGAAGGSTPFGEGGRASYGGTGVTASANSGGGGAGAGGGVTATPPGIGGGAGGYVDAIITAPAASYSYAVGAAGTAGIAGTGGSAAAGGAGAAGVIEVTEYFQ